MSNNVLMIAYHYPPIQGSSGLLRTLKYSQHLHKYDWVPLVLTVHPRAYPNVKANSCENVPENAYIFRAFSLDSARHLAIRGSYLSVSAWPDRWVSWWVGALISSIRIYFKYKPKIIWSTYPIATAHLIGLTLSKLYRLSWVADFRDSMTEEHYPKDPKVRRIYEWIERQVIKHADAVVFTTPGTLDMYRMRYPEINVEKWKIISNGYDEEDFKDLLDEEKSQKYSMILVHSGILYPSERNPIPFFSAISELKKEHQINSDLLKIVLRATGHDDQYQSIISNLDIADIVTLAPSVPYKEALNEMKSSSGLLLFQASNCNHQIPAKLYEYLRAQRPILALTDWQGDTAKLMLSLGVDTIVRLDSKEDIKAGLMEFLDKLDKKICPIASLNDVKKFSRESQTEELAGLFNSLMQE